MYLAVALCLVSFGSLLFIYNNLVSYRNRADSALSTIDVMLKKRWDLIPNLVAVVKGYMQHEASLLERIATLRSTAVSSAIQSGLRMDAENQLSSAIGQFRIAVEHYPVLQANEQFLRLQESLNECEEQISAARRAFNATILQYNNSVDMFPSNLVASFFKFGRREFFEINDSERQAPSVS